MGLTDRWVRTFYFPSRTTASRGRPLRRVLALLPSSTDQPTTPPEPKPNQIPLVRASVRARRRPPLALLFRPRRRGGGSEAAEGIAAAAN